MWLTENGNKVNTTNSFGVDQFGWGNVGDCFNGWKNTELTRWYHFKSSNEFISHPVLCRFADRERAKHFRFISHEVTFSEPRIHAAIAAAPYYADLETSGSPSTTWGKEMSSGAGSSESDTWGGSLIMGYEHSYSAPFLSSMKAGVEFTAKISAGATRTTGTEQTISTGSNYTAGKTHVVVMQASPYDTYTYEIIASDEPDDIGMNFVVSIPRDRRFVNLTLEDYIRFTADQNGLWHLKVPSGLAFDQLVVNGKRATVARSPNREYLLLRHALKDDRRIPSWSYYRESPARYKVH